jgi:hypothetical protein
VVLGALLTPAPPTKAQRKGTVKSGTALVCALGGLATALTGGLAAAWAVSSAIHTFGINVANEIPLSAAFRDPNFSQRAAVNIVSLPRSETDTPGFPESVNRAQNEAINARLEHAGVVVAWATAANRFFEALRQQKEHIARLHVQDINALFARSDQLEDEVAAAFEKFAQELERTGSDRRVDEKTFRDYQWRLLTEGYPPQVLALYERLRPQLDPILLQAVDPLEDGRRWTLALDLSFCRSVSCRSVSEGSDDRFSFIGGLPCRRV